MLICTALSCAFPQSARSAELASPWFARVWQTEDGLPGDNVTGVAQTQDGYLWLSTQSGLARFDGVRIQRVPIPIGRPHPIIRAMLLDKRENLWLAEEGGVVVCMEPGGKSRMLTTTNGLINLLPMQITWSSDDSIWISYVDGSACRIAGDKVTKFGENEGLAGTGPCVMISDEEGQLWYAKGGQVGKREKDHFAQVLTLNDRSVQIVPAHGYGLWICAADQLYKYDKGTTAELLGEVATDAAKVKPTVLFEDRQGALWIGTAASGLFRYDAISISKVDTSHGYIRNITEDREGNIWVGTDGGGLNRLQPRVVELQSKEAGLPFETVRSVCEDSNGGLWAITQNGELAHSQGGLWERVSSDTEWDGGLATCVTSGADGSVWIGTHSHGLYHWQNGHYTVYRRRDGLADTGVRALFMDSRSNLWIGLAAGSVVQRFHGGQFQNFAQPAGSRAVRAITEDAAGTVWMANLDAQLLRVNGEELVDETAQTVQPPIPIRCLGATTDGSLWIGYSGGGLGNLKAGRFVRLSAEQGLWDDNICSLMPDDKGRLWFSTDHGIFQAKLTELEKAGGDKAAGLECRVYGRDDGLPSLQGYYGYSPSAGRTRNGRLLFATHSGLVIVHPDRVRVNPVPPQVIIEHISVDNKELETGQPGQSMRLPPGNHKLEIHFAAPSFIAPERVRFQYKLEGWDETWADAGSLRGAVYSRLSPGQYRFRVKACNGSGVWNESGAAFGFVVRPFLWQLWWFWLIVLALFSGCLVALVRYLSFQRLRSRLRELEHESVLQKERTRIATEIHDDLGARLTQISLLGDLTQDNLPHPEKTGEQIQQIANLSREGIKSLNEIVWALNPRNDTLPDLLDYVGQYALDFLRAAGIRCRIDFPQPSPVLALSADVRHCLFLVIKEALHNVVKHAHASEVWLRVQATQTTVRWTVEDDGKGFDAAPENALDDGLRNMRQRVADLGGVFQIEGRPGSGARISFEVPISRKK